MDDQTKANQLIDRVSALFSLAIKQGNNKKLNKLVKISRLIIDIKKLYEAFGNHRHIGGRNGVNQCLGISRNGVYCKLKETGLTADDFQFRSANVYSLIIKSRTLKLLLEKVKKIR